MHQWQPAQHVERRGRFVTLAPLEADRDVEDLYALAHATPADSWIWTYLPYGPFATQAAMHLWLQQLAGRPDLLFHSVTSLELQRKVGLLAIMNVVAEAGRAELGHIWYAPLVHKSKVNTETCYLLLAYLFDELGYRRAEWKCDNANARSKATAQRMGFVYEGVFRQHMLVKGRNRDTAWFSMLDGEWPTRKAHFERYLYGDAPVSLAALNGVGHVP